MSDYDFKTHAVFEASAGTGKTHKIGQLVIEAVADKKVLLQNILVVTYTDKAAGELKERLRRALEEESAKASGERQARLQAALNSYDDAQIFTIHAFCLRVLRQNPLSHGYSGRGTMTPDADVMQTCLRHVQRAEWTRQYGSELVTLLDLSGFTDSHNGGENWEKNLEKIARNFRPACEHELRPAALPDAKAALEQLSGEFRASIEEIRKMLGPVSTDVAEHPLYSLYDTFPMQKNYREPRQKQILAPLLRWLGAQETLERPVASLLQLVDQCKNDNGRFNKIFFNALIEIKKGAIEAKFAGLMEIIKSVEALRCRVPQLEYQLSVDTVKNVLTAMDGYKLEHGLQSYEDFLTRVYRALSGSGGDVLLKSLRDKYSIAIVDEFQDTDPIQWRIFERIFVVPGDTAHNLIVVGDPKQAIYGFRNADVDTYLAARKRIGEVSSHAPYALTTNYRSSKDMVAALNRVFKNGVLFPSGDVATADTRIAYDDVTHAPDEARTEIVGADESKRKALTLVRFEGASKIADARRIMAQFVGEEIDRLLHGNKGNATFQFKKRSDAARLLRAGDIAVLVFSRKEARPIEEQLRARGIAHSFYKKSGIWESDEAIHLGFVLKALARSGDEAAFCKMLLTRFVGIAPENIAAFERSASGEALRRLYGHWQQQAGKARWAELFRSIMEDTGTFWQEGTAADGARRVANYRHIIQTLAQDAYENGHGLLDLVCALDEKRASSNDAEMGLQPLETENSSVQIMTVHASKGLEFPVVFLAGGFSGGVKSKTYFKYHENGKIVFQLDKSDEAAEAQDKKESNDETRRMLYVALTRAMLKLYLPHPEKYSRSIGPLVDVLRPVLDMAKPESETEICAVENVRWKKPEVEAPKKVERPVLEKAALPLPKPLFPHYDGAALAKRRVEVRSFSRMVHHQARPDRFAERDPHEDDVLPQENQFDALASGIAAGDTLHAIFEYIDFEAVGSLSASPELLDEANASNGLIRHSVERHLGASESREQQRRRLLRVSELVFNTLRTPLTALKGSTLCELKKAERLHELEFHMPFDVLSSEIEEIRRGEGGFLTGCMDLVFRHGGRWFLLDWKSNTLPHYSRTWLEREIQERHYDLQFRIYLQALKRWMQRINKGADLVMEFGGVLYMFMRGMNGKDDKQGVYFHAPNKMDWDEKSLARDLRTEIFRRRNS